MKATARSLWIWVFVLLGPPTCPTVDVEAPRSLGAFLPHSNSELSGELLATLCSQP